MLSVDSDQSAKPDHASTAGVELLGQITRHLIEAQSIVHFLATQVDLNLDELSGDLTRAADNALEAFDAANLLRTGAPLDESWGTRASRPKAVFARHNAAVAAGAPRVTQRARVPLVVYSLPTPEIGEPPVKPRQADRLTCGKPTKTTGKPCANYRVILDDETQANGCSQHLSDHQRPSYERQKARTDAWENQAAEYQRTNREHLMVNTVGLWLERQALELGHDWEEFARKIGVPADESFSDSIAQQPTEQYDLCSNCAPLVTDMAAIASAGMRLLRSWAASQKPPQWADPKLDPGDWLLETPPRARAQQHELGLHLGIRLFAQLLVMAPISDEVLEAHERQVIDTMVGAFPSEPPPPAEQERTATAPRPGARPTSGKRPKKTRKKR